MKDTFITRCRFGFPREARDEATLLSVEECMKLSCTTFHARMYNTLILMLRKANMDLQYVGPVRHWLRDQGGEEQQAGTLAGGLLSLFRIQHAVLVRCTQLALQGVRGQRSPSRRPPVWKVPDRQVDRCVAATGDSSITPSSWK